MQITVNGAPLHLPDTVNTVAMLVNHMQLTGKRIAIERNSEIVPRSQFGEVRLSDGDTLEIVGAVGGG